MFYTYKKDLSFIQNLLENLIDGFFKLDIIYQYAIMAILIYVLVLGMIEFVKKVLIYIPRKIIGIFVIVVIIFIVIKSFR